MGNQIMNSGTDSNADEHQASIDIPLGSNSKLKTTFNFDIEEWFSLKQIRMFREYSPLPTQFVIRIFHYLRPGEFYNLMQVSKLYRRLLSTNDFWRKYYSIYFPNVDVKRNRGRSVNWKKEFFVTYSETNEYYERRFEIVNNLSFGKDVEKTTVKLCVLGPRKVGKTCLLNRFAKDNFDEQYTETVGAQFLFKSTVRVRTTGMIVEYNLWDGSGSLTEIGQHLLPLYMKGAKAVLCCFSIDNKTFLSKLKFSMWTINKYAKNVSFLILVGLKSDLKRKVSVSAAESFAKKNGFVKYVECSAKEDINTFIPFAIIADLISSFTSLNLNFTLVGLENEALKREERTKKLRAKQKPVVKKSTSLRPRFSLRNIKRN